MNRRAVLWSLGFVALADVASAHPLVAQSDTTRGRAPTGTVEGVVFDSLLTHGPLRGASVYLVGTPAVATSDARGRFVLTGVPAGDHTVTFSHAALDSVGIQAPQVMVHVGDGVKAQVTIATPNGATLVKAMCSGQRDEQTGLLLGAVRDVDTGAPLPGARVSSRWFELTIDRQGPHYATLETSATADAGGVFRLCGVPADIPVLVRAQAETQQSGRVEVYFNGSDVAFRDFAVSLTDTAARATPDSLLASSEDSNAVGPPRGLGTVRGVVRDQNGRPLGDARVSVLDRRGDVTTDGDGRFVLSGIPAGTQTLELRAIGYAPTRKAIVVRSGSATETTVALDKAAQTLAQVRVLGGRYLNNSGFDDRRRRSLGWFLTADEIEKQGGIALGDVLRSAPGLVPNYTSRGRTFTMRSLALGGRCTPAYYLDGLRWYPLDENPIIELEKFVSLHDVAGVEVYTGGAATPAQFDPNTGCGAVVFWTKH